MVNSYSNHLHDIIFGEQLPKATLKASCMQGLRKANKELNVRPLKQFAIVKRINADKYTIRAFTNRENVNMIIKRLKAFNDMEIAYDADLDSDELIVKSKKELWTISKADNGEFILQRSK